jgi:uncharacterized protein
MKKAAVRPGSDNGAAGARVGGISRLVVLVLAAVVLLVWLEVGWAANPSDPPRRIEVLFLGHDAELHRSDVAAQHLTWVVAKEGINISYTTDPDDLNPPKLAKYDALILYANHDEITPDQERALFDFIESGKGFLPIHAASYSFRNSDRYVELVGAQFQRHGEGEFTADIVQADHPVMRNLEPFETWDETYVHVRHNPDRVVLMDRVEGDHREPWTWVRTHGAGRVFYTAYGHDERTWSHPGFQALLRNAILWAVGDQVRAQWQQLELPALQYTESSWIPNYERRVPPPRLQEPLSPEASMQHMQVPPGFELQLFAAEPDIANPIAMTWDERGRLWLAETVDYPNTVREPGEPGRDRITILEDTNGDGRADKITVFADSLNIPTGLVLVNGGVIIAQAPNFLFLRDTTGDDRADVQEVILMGWGTFDTHAGPSNLRYGFDNRIWGVVGYSGYRGVVNGDSLNFGQAAYRLRPDGSELEHVASFSNNTWGLGFSETFDIFGSTANNTHAVYVGVPLRFSEGVRGLPARFGSQKIDGHYEMRPITPNIRQVDVFGGFTSAAGINLYTARSFPREYWNRVALVSEPTGHLLHKAVLERRGAGYTEKDGWNLLASTDEWVSPVDAQVGPDGAVWIADWYNFIIQHNPTPPGFETGPGNAHENPLRDRTHGRIYRLVYRNAPASRPLDLSNARPAELVRALQHDNLFWRLTAQRLLVERGDPDVLGQLYRLVQNRRVDELGLNSAAVHALWTMHGLGALDGSNRRATSVALEALSHPAAGVRKAAIEVLPRNAQTLQALLGAGNLEDADPITRKAAVLALAELSESEDLGARLYTLSVAPEVAADEWLSDAVYVAAARHRSGFLNAYERALGASEFRALAARLAEEEAAPRATEQPISFAALTQRQQPTEPAPRPPVAERLLRAYVEDIVGPIERQPPAEQRPLTAGEEPPLEITIGMKIGQMAFDVDEFTVKPGQRVRLRLENPDEMPHNLLILRPGTTDAVGALADAMMTAPDAAERQYIPATPDVLWATRMLAPHESDVIEFTAPRDVGDYPYLCTFPGHWRLMQGTMKVVE